MNPVFRPGDYVVIRSATGDKELTGVVYNVMIESRWDSQLEYQYEINAENNSVIRLTASDVNYTLSPIAEKPDLFKGLRDWLTI